MSASFADRRVVLGVSGGVAAFKAVTLLRLLQKRGIRVRVVLTPAATRFVGVPTFRALSQEPVATDLWDLDQSKGGELHVEWGEWADATVLYPATADSLGRLAAGRAQDLLALCLLCSRGPVVLCPAMHHRMFLHPLVARTLRTLRGAGMRVLDPTVGPLASGEVGAGRLVEPEVALEGVLAALSPQDLRGRRVVVSSGPTREHLDPVRFLSNPSTGRMGHAIAQVAARRGAEVVLVAGPVSLPAPPFVKTVEVVDAAEMALAVEHAAEGADAVIMAAAVADFTPHQRAAHKVKKDGAPVAVELRPTRDILLSLSDRRAEGARPVLVGFAMETESLLRHAQEKLRRKRLDLLVANHLLEPGAGFAVETNVVTLLRPGRPPAELPKLDKEAVAARILDVVAELLGPALP